MSAREREGISYLIKKYGYPLVTAEAANGVKALEYMEEHPVDILFSDVKMPMMDGLELARTVNERYPKTKIVIFSAYGEFSYAKQALEANAVNYLLKPIELDEFRKVMEGLLQSIQVEQEEKEKQQKRERRNRQNVLYKLLTGALVQSEEREMIRSDLFDNGGPLRLIHIEFGSNIFEQREDAFLGFVQMYFGTQTEYVNLFSNEACLLIREKKYIDREFLEGQLLKLSRDMRAFVAEGMRAIVSRQVETMEDLEREITSIQTMGRELLGFNENIEWTEKERSTQTYSQEVESIRRQLMAVVETNRSDLIRQFADQLVEAITTNNMVSKLYVQNIFYTIIQNMYDKNPNIHHEKILNCADVMFYAKNPRDMITLFQKNINEMLEYITDETEDESGIIQKIKNLVEKEYMRDISLNDVAEQVNLAPAYVSYIFKKETGTTLIRYITEIKMEKAKFLLEEGILKINQIARECGYENPSYFNRTFKNYFGITPKQFKER